VETTASTLQNFIFACVAYPEWISNAQKELDEIVGTERLPDFSDLQNLPYIQAVFEETFRWRHTVPGGIPHATTQDDYYKGYLIPKGSTILPLFNAMRQDKKRYDSPEVFYPERWIGKSQHGTFGYGKRVCSGRHIAKRSVTIAIARLLWAFDITAKDGTRPIVNEEKFTNGFASKPKPFEAVFIPRSEKHREIVERSYEAVDKDIACIMDKIEKTLVSEGLMPRA
jgi:cytochrome P450